MEKNLKTQNTNPISQYYCIPEKDRSLQTIYPISLYTETVYAPEKTWQGVINNKLIGTILTARETKEQGW